MEIGDQRVDGTEREAGQDEDSGIAADRRDRFVQSLLDRGLRGGFERSRARRPDGDHAAARSFCPVDPRGGGRIDFAPFFMDRVGGGVVFRNGLERVESDVKRDVGEFNAALFERGDEFVGEMEAGGRRGG